MVCAPISRCSIRATPRAAAHNRVGGGTHMTQEQLTIDRLGKNVTVPVTLQVIEERARVMSD